MSRVHEYYQDSGEMFNCKNCGEDHEVYEPGDFYRCEDKKSFKNLDKELNEFIEFWNKKNTRNK